MLLAETGDRLAKPPRGALCGSRVVGQLGVENAVACGCSGAVSPWLVWVVGWLSVATAMEPMIEDHRGTGVSREPCR